MWSRRAGGPAKVPGSLYLPAASEREVAARALLAACYLAWLAQVVLVQKAFDYVHVPVTFLGMALIAGQRWCFGFAFLVWFLAVGVLVNLAELYPPVMPAVRAIDPADRHVKFEKHPLLDWQVMKLWPRCWTEGGSPEIRDKLGQYTDVHCGTNWHDLNAVATYLRTVEPPLGPRAELLARQHAPAVPDAGPRPGDAVHALRHRVRHPVEARRNRRGGARQPAAVRGERPAADELGPQRAARPAVVA